LTRLDALSTATTCATPLGAPASGPARTRSASLTGHDRPAPRPRTPDPIPKLYVKDHRHPYGAADGNSSRLAANFRTHASVCQHLICTPALESFPGSRPGRHRAADQSRPGMKKHRREQGSRGGAVCELEELAFRLQIYFKGVSSIIGQYWCCRCQCASLKIRV
jgi:hypothetical protein